MTGRQRWTMTAVILGSGIVFLDTSVVNLALPRIAEELDSSWIRLSPLEAQSYVANGYFLALSSLLILAGALTDYHGRKRMFGAGLVGFLVTSVLCGVAPNMELLILFRILQGATGALVVPGSLAIITATFRGEQQGRAFGFWAGASALTTIAGPFVGGVLVDAISWRAAFFINVPFLLVAVAALRAVAESRDEQATGRFDWLGSAVVAVAVGGLAFGVIRGQQTTWQGTEAFVALALGGAATLLFPVLLLRKPRALGPRWLRAMAWLAAGALLGYGVVRSLIVGLTEPGTIAVLAGGATALAISLVFKRGRDNPLVPPKLFRSRNFTVTNLATFVIYGALYVYITFQGLFLIGTLGYNEPAAGLGGLPATLFLALFSTSFGKLAARYGPRLFMATGPLIMGLGLLYLARVPPDSEPWILGTGAGQSVLPPGDYFVDFLPAMVIFGVGLMIMVAPLTTALMTSVPAHNSGVASAINNAISRVGSPLVTALIFVAVVSTFYSSIGDRVPGVDTASPAFRERVAPLNPPQEEADPRVVVAAREASTEAFHLAVVVAAGLLFVGAAINGVGIRNPRRVPEPEGPGPEEKAISAPPTPPRVDTIPDEVPCLPVPSPTPMPLEPPGPDRPGAG